MEYLPLEWIGDVEGGYGMVISIDTTITEALRLEWYARDIIRLIQDMRKEADYHVSDKILLSITGWNSHEILEQFGDMITHETLSNLIENIESPDITKTDTNDENIEYTIFVKKQ
jgi:isoleucyl-tRNA synthetase